MGDVICAWFGKKTVGRVVPLYTKSTNDDDDESVWRDNKNDDYYYYYRSRGD
jgi:hypothetical protein